MLAQKHLYSQDAASSLKTVRKNGPFCFVVTIAVEKHTSLSLSLPFLRQCCYRPTMTFFLQLTRTACWPWQRSQASIFTSPPRLVVGPYSPSSPHSLTTCSACCTSLPHKCSILCLAHVHLRLIIFITPKLKSDTLVYQKN